MDMELKALFVVFLTIFINCISGRLVNINYYIFITLSLLYK